MYCINKDPRLYCYILVLMIATLSTLCGCGDDVGKITTVETEDEIPPASIVNLEVADTSSTTATLVWTATGDDGWQGRAAEYDIRYSTSPITDSLWFDAWFCLGEPKPKPAGSIDTFAVTKLKPATDYYFAIRVLDEAGNTSEASNVVSQMTTPHNYVTWERICDLDASDTPDLSMRPDGSLLMGGENNYVNYDAYGNLLRSGNCAFVDRSQEIHQIYGLSDGTAMAVIEDSPYWLIARVDKTGNPIWITPIELLGLSLMECFIEDPSGGFMGTGIAILDTDSTDYYYSFVTKFDEDGQFDWVKPMEDSTDNTRYYPVCIDAIPGGGFYVLDRELQLIRLDS